MIWTDHPQYPPDRAEREAVMGILSWLGFRKPGGVHLVHSGPDKPRIEEIKRAAAEDVARVEEDDKYFDPDSPGNQKDAL
jgi:hypothetical protein